MQLQRPGSLEEDRLRAVELNDPEPGADQVRIAVEACAMCRTDLQIATGDLPPHRQPVIPGHQVVGTVEAVGANVSAERIGQRVGLAWLANACGKCRFCRSNRENLCEYAQFTGWDVDGGYATTAIASARYAFPLDVLEDRRAGDIAPLMCAGVIGYRALRIAEIDHTSRAKKLGLYGYGASARQVLQIAKHWGVETFVVTRACDEIKAAREAGASWAGLYDDEPPTRFDAAITFAPVGSVVTTALSNLDRGGIVAINAIHLDEIPAFNYDDLWWERSLRSVANVTHADVAEYIDLVAAADLHATHEELPLAEANKGLRRMAAGEVEGSFVLTFS